MSWILLAIFAYLCLAITNLTDKFLLDKVLTSAKTYTFLVNIAGLLVILAAPWLLYWPGWQLAGLNLLAGALFPLALLMMYEALKVGEPSKVLVLIGGSVPVFTVLLSFLFLGERFLASEWLALLGLITGSALIAWLPEKPNWFSRVTNWLGFERQSHNVGIAEAMIAALIFALVTVSSKSLYSAQTFASAFIWIRIGSGLAVFFMLIPKKLRHELQSNFAKLHGKKAGMFFANQGLSAFGFTLQNYALSLGSAAIVSALQGVQYALLLVLGAILSLVKPGIVKENIAPAVVFQKIIAILMISISLYLLV